MILTGVLQGAAGFGLYLLTIALLLRRLCRREPALIVTAAAIVMWLLMLLLLVVIGQRVNFWTFGTSYWFFTICFLMVFGAIYKSISLRILQDLLRQPQHSERYDRILARYIVNESFRDRLRVIADKGLAEWSGKDFKLTPRGRAIVGSIYRLQQTFGITKSG